MFVPTQGSFLIWKYLYREGIGAHQRCLDIGCGTGLLAVQLARNGAAHVHAIDIDAAAVKNTLDERVPQRRRRPRHAPRTVDLFPWVPEERYDVIVASLYQMPVDPFEQVSTHRPLDYWGRNLIDHLIRLLPEALADDGVAYMHAAVDHRPASARSSSSRRPGYRSRVVDFAFFEFHELFRTSPPRSRASRSCSDAYHLKLGDADVMVAYLLEISDRSLSFE